MEGLNAEKDKFYIVAHNGYRFDFKYIYEEMIRMYGGYIVGSFDNLKQITAGPYRFIDTSTLL